MYLCILHTTWLELSLAWHKIDLLFAVVQSLAALVNDPEPEHPLRADLAEEFLKDRKKFNKTAEEFTKKHADKRPSWSRHVQAPLPPPLAGLRPRNTSLAIALWFPINFFFFTISYA